MPQTEFGGDAMDPVRTVRRGHLVWEILKSLPVDYEQIPGFGGSASLVEKTTEEQLRCAHSESSSRVRTTLMVLAPCSESAFRACARKLEMVSGSFGSTRNFSRTTRGGFGGSTGGCVGGGGVGGCGSRCSISRLIRSCAFLFQAAIQSLFSGCSACAAASRPSRASKCPRTSVPTTAC